MIRRDVQSNAIINEDAEALNKYKRERNNYRKMESLSKELDEVKVTLKRVCEVIERMDSK